jgi:hypothetical protein
MSLGPRFLSPLKVKPPDFLAVCFVRAIPSFSTGDGSSEPRSRGYRGCSENLPPTPFERAGVSECDVKSKSDGNSRWMDVLRWLVLRFKLGKGACCGERLSWVA